jgi:hypothetical protein
MCQIHGLGHTVFAAKVEAMILMILYHDEVHLRNEEGHMTAVLAVVVLDQNLLKTVHSLHSLLFRSPLKKKHRLRDHNLAVLRTRHQNPHGIRFGGKSLKTVSQGIHPTEDLIPIVTVTDTIRKNEVPTLQAPHLVIEANGAVIAIQRIGIEAIAVVKVPVDIRPVVKVVIVKIPRQIVVFRLSRNIKSQHPLTFLRFGKEILDLSRLGVLNIGPPDQSILAANTVTQSPPTATTHTTNGTVNIVVPHLLAMAVRNLGKGMVITVRSPGETMVIFLRTWSMEILVDAVSVTKTILSIPPAKRNENATNNGTNSILIHTQWNREMKSIHPLNSTF